MAPRCFSPDNIAFTLITWLPQRPGATTDQDSIQHSILDVPIEAFHKQDHSAGNLFVMQ